MHKKQQKKRRKINYWVLIWPRLEEKYCNNFFIRHVIHIESNLHNVYRWKTFSHSLQVLKKWMNEKIWKKLFSTTSLASIGEHWKLTKLFTSCFPVLNCEINELKKHWKRKKSRKILEEEKWRFRKEFEMKSGEKMFSPKSPQKSILKFS